MLKMTVNAKPQTERDTNTHREGKERKRRGGGGKTNTINTN